MAIETTVNKEWSIRLLIISVAFGAWGCWSVYDGFVGYPNQRELYRMTHGDTDGTTTGVLLDRAEWEPAVVEAGYDPDAVERKINKLKPRTQWDLNAQYIMAGICFPIAIAAFFWMLHHARRKPRVDEQGLSFAGHKVPFGSIEQIDKDLWESKGIASIRYKVNGKAGVFKMDDWKYKGAKEAIEFIEQRLGTAPAAEAPAEPASEATTETVHT